jgi:hypothetical protein
MPEKNFSSSIFSLRILKKIKTISETVYLLSKKTCTTLDPIFRQVSFENPKLSML